MKVTFIYPDISIGSRGKFYPGIASLSACLRQARHKTGLLHITQPLNKKEYLDLLEKECPDLVAFSSTTNTFPYVVTFAKWTKDYADVPTICGGIHTTLAPEEAIKTEGIDMVCLGEGEKALVELCTRLESKAEITDIENLWLKRNGKIYRNPLRPLIQDLDTLPFQDREVFNYRETYDMKVWRRGIFMASRGCPYKCTYCSNYALRQAYEGKGKYVRFRSVDNIISEIEKVVNDYPGIEYIAFHDDILPLQRRWFQEFCEKYPQRIKLPFQMNGRADLLDEEIIKMAKAAGCKQISLGIESGNDFIRENVMSRGLAREQILKAFSLCHQVGIETYSYNMIGLPFETVRMILDTIKLNAQVKPRVMQVSIFYPYPGTDLYELCKKHDFLTAKSQDSYYEDSILALNTITANQTKFLFRFFHLLVRFYTDIYRLPQVISPIIEKAVDVAIPLTTSRALLPFTLVTYPALRGVYRGSRKAIGLRRLFQKEGAR